MSRSSLAAPLRTVDGVHLAAHVWRPLAESGTGVVLVHGFTGAKDHPGVVAVAERLLADGHHVVSYDARGHGESGGRCALGNHEHRDVAAAVAELRSHLDRVVIVGASMGGISVLRYAAEADDIAGVVAVSAPARWRLPRSPQGVLAALLTQTNAGRKVLSQRMNVRMAGRFRRSEPPAHLVTRISAPIALVHGRADRFLRHHNAEELYAAANDPKRLFLVPGMGHAFDDAAPAVVSEAVAWTLSPA